MCWCTARSQWRLVNKHLLGGITGGIAGGGLLLCAECPPVEPSCATPVAEGSAGKMQFTSCQSMDSTALHRSRSTHGAARHQRQRLTRTRFCRGLPLLLSAPPVECASLEVLLDTAGVGLGSLMVGAVLVPTGGTMAMLVPGTMAGTAVGTVSGVLAVRRPVMLPAAAAAVAGVVAVTAPSAAAAGVAAAGLPTEMNCAGRSPSTAIGSVCCSDSATAALASSSSELASLACFAAAESCTSLGRLQGQHVCSGAALLCTA